MAQGRRIHGHSLELVNYFFWAIAVHYLLYFVPEIPSLAEVIAPTIAVLGVLTLIVAGILGFRERCLRSQNLETTGLS